MSRRLRTLLAAAAALSSLAVAQGPAFAWGRTGHRVIAAIADQNLSGLARAHIRAILGTESLDEAATWPDEMRSDPDPFWQKTASPWHYVTVAGHEYDLAPPEGDAISALRHFSAVLRDPSASLKDRQMALRFVVHLVGDLHQPLHAGNGTDKGGNDVKVTFDGRPTNLHSVWDSGLVDEEQLSFSEYAARLERRTTPQDVVAWWDANPVDWVRESATIRDTIYPRDPKLGWDYSYRMQPIVRRRLQQGGVRLAAYLDWVFAAPHTVQQAPQRTRRHG
ncbi:MAG TPA: S1/P1 nuclease [Allosphingosinicella sp.]|nr:S1/P1 nuclease [Allosphingosinicella sp.]